MRTSQDYETGNWHGKWCAASLKSFVRINKYLKNENTVICQESFQSSLPMCTQTQDVLKTFRVNIFLLFLLLFFRSAELWVHSSTAVGVAGYILSSARAALPPDYPSPTRRGCTWPTPAWWCPGTCRPTRATQHSPLTRCHCQLTSLYIRTKWETCGFLVGAESFCLHVGGGGDGGLHPRAGGLLGLLSPLHQICQGQHWVGRYLKNNDNTAKMVLRWFYACNCLSVNQLENCQSYSLHSENLSSNKKNIPGWLPLPISLSTSTFHFHFSLPLSIFHFPLLLSTFHFHFPGWLPTGVFCWSRLYHHHNRQARFNLWS